MKGECCDTESCCRGAGPFFGRLLISLIFILAGIGKIFIFEETSQAFAQMGIPAGEFFTLVGLLMELVGGILLLLGWYTRFAVFLLMVFLLPTTLLFHAFWEYQGEALAMQLSNFLKNLTIYGGLLLILSYGPGSWSIDAKRKCCSH